MRNQNVCGRKAISQISKRFNIRFKTKKWVAVAHHKRCHHCRAAWWKIQITWNEDKTFRENFTPSRCTACGLTVQSDPDHVENSTPSFLHVENSTFAACTWLRRANNLGFHIERVPPKTLLLICHQWSNTTTKELRLRSKKKKQISWSKNQSWPPQVRIKPRVPYSLLMFHLPTAMSSLVLWYPKFSLHFHITHSLLIGLPYSCQQCQPNSHPTLHGTHNSLVELQKPKLTIIKSALHKVIQSNIKSNNLMSVIIKRSKILVIGFLRRDSETARGHYELNFSWINGTACVAH